MFYIFRLLFISVLIFSFQTHAKALTTQQWIDVFRVDGVNIFYSSDYINQKTLDQVLDIDSKTIESLNNALNEYQLKVTRVDKNIYVIKPHKNITIPTTGLIVQVTDAKLKKSLKNISANLVNQKVNFSKNGFIAFLNIKPDEDKLTVSSSGFYPKTIALNLQKGKIHSLSVELKEKPIRIDKIVVTASRFNLEGPNASNHSLLRQDIENSVNNNNDPLRTVSNLPGNTSNGLSGKYRTRGGHENESLILLDDFILRNPYHFNHFYSLYSNINQSIVDGIDFYSGVFPLEFGGRLSSVLIANSGDNTGREKNEFGIDFINAYYTRSYNSEDYNKSALMSVRRSLNLHDEVIVNEGYIQSEIYDGYFKFQQQINDHLKISQHMLTSSDEISIQVDRSTDPDEIEEAVSKHKNNSFWMQLHYDSERVSSFMQLYYNNSSSTRDGRLFNETSDSEVDEETNSSYFGIKYQQKTQLLDNLNFSYGIDLFQEKTRINSDRKINHIGELVELLDLQQSSNRRFNFDNQGFASNYFINTRYQFNPKLIFDIGIRYEQKQWIEQNVKSPRFNMSYFYNDSTTIRFGLGRHQQSQYIDELYLEDRNPDYYKPASADVAVLEFNKSFPNNMDFRIEFYRKEYSNTLPYYENEFNELHILPDLYFDRIKVSPDDSYANGIELTLKGQQEKISWLANYTYSDVEDETDDEYHLRSWNQRHSLKFNLNMPIKSWIFNIASNYSSGSPRTTISQNESGIQVSDRNAESFKNRLELNVKISKKYKLGNGVLDFSFQVNNLTNSFNTCCVDYSIDDGELELDEKHWLPITPNASLIYSWD